MVVIQECLKDSFEQNGWSRIPEILYKHAEDAAKHNHSYLELQFGRILPCASVFYRPQVL
ncbi:hypothetical protein A7K91_05015 [Paenibacillus oryzae]|uniref:Uncharacterized protein n=1 Tax=Paenibacillus oryzae TaxID=1844972 RepID=A0A1A5YHB3_9BACL|nr:hypothetical protein A7K91_05015 [Paenibacillus oryzae]